MTCFRVTAVLVLFTINIPVTWARSPGNTDSLSLTLDQAIELALDQSFDIRTLRLDLEQARQQKTAAKGRFKTNAELEVDTPYWSETVSEIPREGDLPVFNTTGLLRYQGRLDINQPLPTNGVFTLSSRTYHRSVSTYRPDLNQDLQRKDVLTSVSLRLNQPLFTLNTLQVGLRTANLNYKATDLRFNRQQWELVYSVTQAFYRLYRAEQQLAIARQDVEQQEQLVQLAKKKLNAGLIPEVESLQMEVDLAESQNNLVTARGEVSRIRDQFCQLIGLDFDVPVSVEADLQVQKLEIDLEHAVQKALQNRTDIREQKIDVELASIDIREADARSDFRGDLWAFYDITGISDPSLPFDASPGTLWESALTDAERRPNNRGVGVTFSIPLWDWGVNAAEVQAAKARLRNRQLELAELKKTIVRQVRDAVSRLTEAENRLRVLEKSSSVAERAFEISTRRFSNGDITSQTLALDRERLNQTRFSYLSAYVDYKLALADLRRKTMWDFNDRD